MSETLSKKTKGILLMLGSALSFCIMQIFVNLAGDIPTMVQVFFRNVLIFILAGILVVRHQGGTEEAGRQQGSQGGTEEAGRQQGSQGGAGQVLHALFGPRQYQLALFARSGFGLIAVCLSFYAYSHASQGEVATLVRLSPFFISLFAVMFLGEKLKKSQIYALFVAFAGALLVARPGFHSDIVPLAAAFLAAVVSSIAYTTLRYFAGKVDGMTVITHFAAVSILGTLPFVLKNFVMPDATQVVQLFLIGILGFFGQIGVTYAYRMAPASEISIYDYSGIVFSAILGFLILGEELSFLSLAGAGLVIAAALINLRSTREADDV